MSQEVNLATTQDGANLAAFLFNNEHKVLGIKCRTLLLNNNRIDHLCLGSREIGCRFIHHHSELPDSPSLTHIIQQVQYDERPRRSTLSRLVVDCIDRPESW